MRLLLALVRPHKSQASFARPITLLLEHHPHWSAIYHVTDLDQQTWMVLLNQPTPKGISGRDMGNSGYIRRKGSL